MKRLVVWVLLASLIAITCVLTAGAASSYTGNANVSWASNMGETFVWLYVQNAGKIAATTVRLALPAAAVVQGGYTTLWDGSYQYVILPTPLAPGAYVALTITSTGKAPIGLTGVELGVYYTWFALPAGTQATVANLAESAVVVKSADGKLNTLFAVNPVEPARFVRLRGTAVAVGGTYKTLANESYLYVDLGSLTVAGKVTALPLLGGEVTKIEFGGWSPWSVTTDAETVFLRVYNLGAGTVNQLYVNIANPDFDDDWNPTINADMAGSIVYTAGGAIPLALTETDTRFWDVATSYDGGIQRFWLPADLQPNEYVVVKFVGTGVVPVVFDAQLGNLIPR